MQVRFFKDVNTVAELKQQYKKLILKHHPDVVGGSNEDMKIINAEYEYLFKHVVTDEDVKIHHDINDGYREMLEKFIHLEGLEIEICGSWLWLGGNTYAHRETLKKLGCRYSAKKYKWYYYNGIEKQKAKFKGHYSMAQIRNRFGSMEVQAEETKKIA